MDGYFKDGEMLEMYILEICMLEIDILEIDIVGICVFFFNQSIFKIESGILKCARSRPLQKDLDFTIFRFF